MSVFKAHDQLQKSLLDFYIKMCFRLSCKIKLRNTFFSSSETLHVIVLLLLLAAAALLLLVLSFVKELFFLQFCKSLV